MSLEVPIGTRAEVTRTVEHQHTLANVSSEMPPVLSTPHMIGWMEIACYFAQKPFCEDGEVTVGTRIDVVHRSPCSIGSRVTASAELERTEGRFYIYKVEAALNTGLKIGWGHVHRAVVHLPKFMQKL
jgi:predicted thioesterase